MAVVSKLRCGDQTCGRKNAGCGTECRGWSRRRRDGEIAAVTGNDCSICHRPACYIKTSLAAQTPNHHALCALATVMPTRRPPLEVSFRTYGVSMRASGDPSCRETARVAPAGATAGRCDPQRWRRRAGARLSTDTTIHKLLRPSTQSRICNRSSWSDRTKNSLTARSRIANSTEETKPIGTLMVATSRIAASAQINRSYKLK